MKNFFEKIAAFMGDFCDLKNFYKRDSSCPIPNVTKDIQLSKDEISDLEKLHRMNHPDSEKVLNVINSVTSEGKGELGEYGFPVTSLYSVLGVIDSLEDSSEVKKMILSLLESKEDDLSQMKEGEERLQGWKNIFLDIKSFLEGKYGEVRETDPEKEKLFAQINHKDPLDSYKNEVEGCLRKGTCCIKCDHLIDCPVPEHICSRVQNWNLETRTELAKSEGVEKPEDVPGFDPANIKHTMEPIPSKSVLEKLKVTDPKKYEYYEKLKQRKETEKKSEKNPYVQKAEELELEESFPGIMEWYRAMWDWLLDLKDKKIPEVNSEGKPTGRFYSFSDKEWQNINAPEIRQFLQGGYPEPTVEEMKEYIARAQKKRTWHSEKGRSMTPEEIIAMVGNLPGLEGFSENLKDYYSESSLTGKPKIEPGE